VASKRGDPDIERTDALLGAGDPSPVKIANAKGRSLFLLLGDHAGNAVPAALAGLGLSDSELTRHIALDLGVEALGFALSARLDAPFVWQRYSRLVVDCNRARGAADAIAPISDGTKIPGNRALTDQERAKRYAEIFEPYHAGIAKMLDTRDGEDLVTAVVSLHSFTPSLAGMSRPWSIGVLHDGGNTRLARAVLGLLRKQVGEAVGDNAPYWMDGTDYTVPRHAYPHRPYVELEVRQDLLASAQACEDMADHLAGMLTAAWDSLGS
jgi:predicted N-formylglutamate amidohydrolase